uniref:Uncharacterized protein n=1 Tax=Anguilla anguilla TaxID=7936 RepID=A0A0E9WVP2_ANGAN
MLPLPTQLLATPLPARECLWPSGQNHLVCVCRNYFSPEC